MPALIIVDIKITDPEKYEKYKTLVRPSIDKYGGRFVVRGGRSETLEGDWNPERIVVLEFESVEKAKLWWDSEEYRGPRDLRWSASTGNMIVVEGA